MFNPMGISFFRKMRVYSALHYTTNAPKTLPIIDPKTGREPSKDEKVMAPEESKSNRVNVGLDTTTPGQLLNEIIKIQIPIVETKKELITSFEDMPGPAVLRYIAKTINFVPILAKEFTTAVAQYFLATGGQLHWGGKKWLFKLLLDEYGPIIRLYGPFGGDVVIISRPEHMETIFAHESQFPIHSPIESLEKYLLEHRKYRYTGPYLMTGPEWLKLREAIAQPLPALMLQQFTKIEDACDEFISRIVSIRNRQDEVPADFQKEIYKWSMECFSLVFLCKKMGFMDPAGVSTISDPGLLMEGIIGATRALQRCEDGFHYWRFVKFPAWNSLVYYCDTIEGVLAKYVDRTANMLKEKKEKTFFGIEEVTLLEKMMTNSNLLPEDVMSILLESFLIGVNTVMHSVAFLFYYLARSPRSQNNLYEEIQRQPIRLTREVISGMPYLQACMKESMRLSPPFPILGRILEKEIVVHNYSIPKGTHLLFANHIACSKEENFEDAQKFLPERWISAGKEVHYACMPFGYGPRTCVAKELVEMEIGLLICKILKRFRIEYHYGDIKSNNRMLALPKRPLKFSFVDIK